MVKRAEYLVGVSLGQAIKKQKNSDNIPLLVLSNLTPRMACRLGVFSYSILSFSDKALQLALPSCCLFSIES